MLKWILGRGSVEDIVPEGEYQQAIDVIHTELNEKPPVERSRPLRQVLAEALLLADRQVEALSVLKDLAQEYLMDGQLDKAIATQKRLEQVAPGAPEAGQGLDAIAKTVDVSPREVEEAQDAMAKSPLFSSFTGEELVAVIGGLKLQSRGPGEILTVEGDPGDSLFVLTDGVVRVYVRNEVKETVQIREMGSGSFFGEISIVYGKPRTATITCKTRCEILQLDRATVDNVKKDHPRVETVLKEFCDRRSGSAEEQKARQG